MLSSQTLTVTVGGQQLNINDAVYDDINFTYTWKDVVLPNVPTTGTTGIDYDVVATLSEAPVTGSIDTNFTLDTIAESPVISTATIATDIGTAVLTGTAEAGGTVYIDSNKNGILDEGEASAVVVDDDGDGIGEWRLDLSTVNTDVDSDGDVATTDDIDMSTDLSFVDAAGNSEGKTGTLYYFDNNDSGGSTYSFTIEDEPEGAREFANPNGTANLQSLNFDGTIDATGNSDKFYVTKFANDETDKVILIQQSMTATAVRGFAAFTGNGNDIFALGRNMAENTRVYLEEGDDTFSVQKLSATQRRNVVVDLGSGNDTAEIGEVNEATIYGRGGNDQILVDGVITGATIDLGEGDDTLTVGSFIQSNTQVYAGNGNDTVTARELNNNNTVLDLGAGDDIVNITGEMGNGIGAPTLNLGAGADELTLNRLSKGTIDTGDDTDVDTVNITSMTGGTLNLGEGDILNLNAMSGGTVNLSSEDDTITIGDVVDDGMSILDLSGGTINGGEGNDTVVVTNQSTLNADRLENIQKVDLGADDGVSNTFTADFRNVRSNGLSELYIDGGSEDVVNLDGLLGTKWNVAGQTEDGAYNIYVGSYGAAPDQTLYIDVDITPVI